MIATRPFDAAYRGFVELLADQIAAGLSNTRAYEEERKRAEVILRESEERFRTMADSAPVMIWVTEPDGACTYLSKSWYEFTGQTPETGLGSGWREAVRADDRAHTHETFVAANARKEAFRVEYRLRRKDGAYRWAIDAAVPRLTPDGRYLGYIGSVIDITERKQAEDALFNARRLESIGVLAGGIAHDFNNILTAILGNVSLAKLHSTQDPVTTEMLGQAEQAAVRARDLTQQLLTFSKGGAPIKKPGASGDLLRETARFALSGANSRLVVDLADNLRHRCLSGGAASRRYRRQGGRLQRLLD